MLFNSLVGRTFNFLSYFFYLSMRLLKASIILILCVVCTLTAQEPFRDSKTKKVGIKADEQTIVKPAYDDLIAFPEHGAAARNGTLWGFVTYDDKETIPIIFDKIELQKGGLVKASKAGKIGFFNTDGQALVPVEFDAIDMKVFDGAAKPTHFLVKKDKKVGSTWI